MPATAEDSGTRRRLTRLACGLAAANLAVFAWAASTAWQRPALLPIFLVAYTLGLRHAVDADHIAAIDNVQRAMVARGQRPVGTGLFFALGHALVVVLAIAAIAAAAGTASPLLARLRDWGGTAGTLISAGFLFAVGLLNLQALAALVREWRAARNGDARSMPAQVQAGGMLSRVLAPATAVVRKPWHMAGLGFLFGLGFDTATEVGLLGMSSAESARGLHGAALMILPCLFAAGMASLDSLDGVLMLRAYGWALERPMRRVRYNLTVTLTSVVVAVGVGGLELLGLVADQLQLHGAVWRKIGALNADFAQLGMLICVILLGTWALCAAVLREERDAATPPAHRVRL